MLLQCSRFIFDFEFLVYRFGGQYVVSYLHKKELADLQVIVINFVGALLPQVVSGFSS